MRKIILASLCLIVSLLMFNPIAMAAEQQESTGTNCYKDGADVICPPAVIKTIPTYEEAKPVPYADDSTDWLEDVAKKYPDPAERERVLKAAQGVSLANGSYRFVGMVGIDFHPFQWGPNGERKFAKIEKFYNAKWVKKNDPNRKGPCIRVD